MICPTNVNASTRPVALDVNCFSTVSVSSPTCLPSFFAVFDCLGVSFLISHAGKMIADTNLKTSPIAEKTDLPDSSIASVMALKPLPISLKNRLIESETDFRNRAIGPLRNPLSLDRFFFFQNISFSPSVDSDWSNGLLRPLSDFSGDGRLPIRVDRWLRRLSPAMHVSEPDSAVGR